MHDLLVLLSVAAQPFTIAVALSHASAVVVHGLPVHEVDLDEVHLARTEPGRTGRVARDPAVQVHPPLPAEAFTVAHQLPTCIAPAAVLQVADWHGTAAGMVAAEAGLHRWQFTTTELRDARGLVRLGRGSPHAAFVMRVAGPNSESPGETLTRLLLRALGHATAQQVEVRLPASCSAAVGHVRRRSRPRRLPARRPEGHRRVRRRRQVRGRTGTWRADAREAP